MSTESPPVRFHKRQFNVSPYKDSWHEFEAFHEDRLVGRIACFEAPPGSKECWIHDFWVDPGSRGHGVGSELLRLAVESAQTSGYQRMLGEFRPYDSIPSATVEALFRRHGFTVEENWGELGTAVVLLVFS